MIVDIKTVRELSIANNNSKKKNVAKTIMRKHNFLTANRQYPVGD